MSERAAPPGGAPPEAGEAAVRILHLDMDSFFASVEVLDDPSLAGRPVIVGGSVERGVVASASYEARCFGIRSAMATAEASRRCPDLVVVPPRHARYAEVSRALMEVLRGVTPLVEPVALDEAYLDVAGARSLAGSPGEIARRLRAGVRDELGLGCSVGAGRTKLVAKLASKAAKPRPGEHAGRHAGRGATGGLDDGVVVVEPDAEEAFLQAHPARALPGVGPRTAERLRRFGVETVGDLALVDAGSLVRLLGRAHGGTLHELAHGRDPRRVEPERPVASIGHEETFAVDERSPERLASVATEMAQAVAGRCRSSAVAPRRVTVKVRFADFSTITRSRTLAAPVLSGLELGVVAVELLEEVATSRGVRLLGVHAAQLVPLAVAREAPRQLCLFPEPVDASDVGGAPGRANPAAADGTPDRAERYRRHAGVEAAADEIRRRYGAGAIASLAASTRRRGVR